MNDRPAQRTMTLGSYEWRTLVMTGATNLYTQTQNLASDVPNAEQVKWLHDQLDRLKMQVSAWGASDQQPAASDVPIRAEGAPVNESWANGGSGVTGGVTAAEPKKKRGWQKGRKLGPRQPKGEAVQ